MCNSDMREGSYGFTWKRERNVRPAVVVAVNSVLKHAKSMHRICRPLWVCDYYLSPCGRVRVGDRPPRWHDCPAQVVHLYPPQTPFWEDMRRAPRPIQSAYMLFTGGEAAGLPRLLEPGARFLRFHDPEGRLGQLIQDAAWVGQTEGQDGFWKAQALLSEMINLMRRSQPAGAGRLIVTTLPPSPWPRWVLTVQAYFQQHLAERITLADLATLAHLSVSALAHRYHQETGESPMHTLRRMRLAAARNLLMKGETLKVIAAETGFCDPYHLAKTFRQMEGLTTRQFLRSLDGE